MGTGKRGEEMCAEGFRTSCTQETIIDTIRYHTIIYRTIIYHSVLSRGPF